MRNIDETTLIYTLQFELISAHKPSFIQIAKSGIVNTVISTGSSRDNTSFEVDEHQLFPVIIPEKKKAKIKYV